MALSLPSCKRARRLTFLTEYRDKEAAACRFLKKAIRRHGIPEKITIDGSDANEAAIKSYNENTAPALSSVR